MGFAKTCQSGLARKKPSICDFSIHKKVYKKWLHVYVLGVTILGK